MTFTTFVILSTLVGEVLGESMHVMLKELCCFVEYSNGVPRKVKRLSELCVIHLFDAIDHSFSYYSVMVYRTA